MDNNNATFGERTKGGHVFVGSDMDIMRAGELWKALNIYASIGMLPTRGVRAGDMLKMASQFTGKTYKRGQYQQAADDLKSHIQWMASQPRSDKPLPKFPV